MADGLGARLFLRCVALVYLFAFASLFIQLPGCFGEHGLLPIGDHLRELKERMPDGDDEAVSLRKILDLPTIFWLLKPSEANMMAVAAAGAVTALLVFLFLSALPATLSPRIEAVATLTSRAAFLQLWMLYVSFVSLGQEFLSFQWDILLLETGALCVFAPVLSAEARRGDRQRNALFAWMARWLLFRLMFASGVVKLTSECPAWWGLTALHFHYITQCIPAPLAWYAHHLAFTFHLDWLHHLSVAATLWIEIIAPLFFFSPLVLHRKLAMASQLLLQLLIFLTGNYNFFNVLTATLCLSLLDWTPATAEHASPTVATAAESSATTTAKPRMVRRRRCSVTWVVGVGSFVAVLVASFVALVRVEREPALALRLAFGMRELNALVAVAVPFSVALFVAGFALWASIALFRAATTGSLRLLRFAWTVVEIAALGAIGVTSVLVFSSALHRPTYEALPRAVLAVYRHTQPLHLSSAYGLFRRMTTERRELIFEGAEKERGPYQELQFKYKPGNTSVAPLYLAPHQPRLDWQMWFAALGPFQSQDWTLHLVVHLLLGTPEVYDLLADNGAPFAPTNPPRFVRVNSERFNFSSWSAQRAWYRRTSAPREYLPSLSLFSPQLASYANQRGFARTENALRKLESHTSKFLPKLRENQDLAWPAPVRQFFADRAASFANKTTTSPLYMAQRALLASHVIDRAWAAALLTAALFALGALLRSFVERCGSPRQPKVKRD